MGRTTAVGLGAEGEGDHVGRDANSASRAAAAGVHGQVVRAAALSAAAGEALRVVAAAHISPLAESGLAKEHSAGVAELGHDVRVAGHDATQESPASCCRLHVVLGANVILDGEGDAVQRTTQRSVLALQVALRGNGKDIGVDLQNRA